MKKWAILLVTAFLVISVVAACSPSSQTKSTTSQEKLKPKTITWGTMVPGTNTYIWTTAWANVINKYGGLDISVQPNADASLNFKLFKSKEILISNTAHLEGWAAYSGLYPEAYPEAQPIRLVASGTPMKFSFMSVDPKIKTIPDLKGKRLYGKQVPPGVSLILPVRAALEAYGLKETDVEILPRVTHPETVRGLIEGKGDAWFDAATPSLDELRRSKPFTPLPIEPAKAKIIADKIPGVIPDVWPTGLYGTTTDTPIIAQVFAIYAHQDLDDSIVYTMLKTMYDHYDELGQIHPALKDWSKNNALRLVTIPVHSGAIKYYKEQGLWTSDIEAKNKKLLDEEPKLKKS